VTESIEETLLEERVPEKIAETISIEVKPSKVSEVETVKPETLEEDVQEQEVKQPTEEVLI
jgi:hypothetical protein